MPVSQTKDPNAVPLAGQVAIITGGSAGIGLAAAVVLGRLGASVVLVGRTARRVDEAVAKIHSEVAQIKVIGLALDVRHEEDMAVMADQTLDLFGRIDILVAAAGVLRAGGGAIRMLMDTPPSEWNEILDINLTGTFLSNRAVLPAMCRQRTGLIVNVSSTSGRKGYAFDAAYCASKFGVIGMTEALAEEVWHYGIRVNVLLPGAIDTPMWDQNRLIPKPEDILPVTRVADLVGFLATLPPDTACLETVIEPMCVHEWPAWRRGAQAQT
jgi:NAD(P)-dependent dehydrogenase (short-subunit alcohol dehydrogenase family)